MSYHGQYHAAAAAGYHQQPLWQQHSATAAAAPQPFAATSASPEFQPITYPTMRDVLNGRGQGVQRHPGNSKYRNLVHVNKGLYAKCPRADKIKISKGIVAAVRELGGRFLELEERLGLYNDIGDKKATEKTSQALREGQTKIRKQMYKDEEGVSGGSGGNNSTYDTSMLDPSNPRREISAEGYFGYSVQILQSLYDADEQGHPGFEPTTEAASSPPPLPAPVVPQQPAAAAGRSAALARAMEQFPGAVLPKHEAPEAQATMPPPLPKQPSLANQAQAVDDISRTSVGRYTEDWGTHRPSLSRLTNMSLASIFSIASIRETLGNQNKVGGDNRGTIETLTTEIRDLIRMSEPQLMEVENGMAAEEMNGGGAGGDMMMHEDREVLLYDGEGVKVEEDRVSELRFTDVTRDTKFGHGVKFEEDRVSELRFTDVTRDTKFGHGGADHNPRLTNSTEATNYSDSSLMDASMMTIPTEDMSVHDGGHNHRSSPQKAAAAASGVSSDDGDLASAKLLLRLSNDYSHGQHHLV